VRAWSSIEATSLPRISRPAPSRTPRPSPMIDSTFRTNPPLHAYLEALGDYDGSRLSAIFERLGRTDRGMRGTALATAIANRLDEPREADTRFASATHGAKLALSLFALAEASTRPVSLMWHSLTCLGVSSPREALAEALHNGMLALARSDERSLSKSFEELLADDPEGLQLRAHPAMVSAARTVLPEGESLASTEAGRQVREADGLEPIVRLAALWQRVAEEPLRQTQQGQLYKRDRERLDEDPALCSTITDALTHINDPVSLWFDLARAIGLIRDEEGTDRMVAAPPEFWAEHAVHLPQMVAVRWMSLFDWHERYGRWEGRPFPAALPALRPVALLWLARQPVGHWTAIDDLAQLLTTLCPGWTHFDAPTTHKSAKLAGGPNRKELAKPPGLLESLLLGPAYQMGLVRAAEEDLGGRRVVALTPLGRYVLALGPAPLPKPHFDHFLFVQPNFEIIAYRQGLTPSLIGQLSRFTCWGQLGGALELKLTPESVYRGLESGLRPEQMLDRLARHSARSLPTGVADAVKTWSSRRERVSYYATATLIEFNSTEALSEALAAWPESPHPAPVQISDRLLLVEDESSIPFHRLRLAGSRDYRRPPESCVEVEPDGVTLVLDLGRSDLFIDAELARFADELPSGGFSTTTRRRFRVSPSSLARGLQDGLTPPALSRWFPIRTAGEMPAAMRLLLHSATPRSAPIQVTRPIVLRAPTPELLDGLTQHPRTRDYLGERLGPTTVLVSEEARGELLAALQALGLHVEL
jgi:hypothetical protein